MHVIVAAVGGMLLSLAGSLVGQVLLALGMGIATYKGVDVTMTFLKSSAVSAFGSLPPQMSALVSYLKVGICINIIFSAMLVRATLTGLQSGAFKRFILK